MRVVWNSQNGKNRSNERVIMESKDLTKYFSEELFIPNLTAKNKKQSLEELAELFVDNKLVRNKEIILEMLYKRETLGSTGIGKGVAIPHGRTTAAMDVKIAFGKSDKGIDFDAIDDEPVKLIFVVLAPPQEEDNRYLPVLGKLVEVLHDKKNRDRFMKVSSYDDLVKTFEELG